MLDKPTILAILSEFTDTHSNQPITKSIVKALQIDPKQKRIQFVLDIGNHNPALYAPLKTQLEQTLTQRTAARDIRIAITGNTPPAPPPPPSAPDAPPMPRKPPPQPQAIPNIKRIVAIASGKGGVGKSTVAANLAVACAAQGVRTGLLDADIYGPSQPHMMGTNDARPELSSDSKTIIPLVRYGVHMMSIGLLLSDPTRAVIWRGPMISSALEQMIKNVAWGNLDLLLIDLPPGTGDVPLSLAQRFQLSGVIIVSTPQDIAMLDARKAITMFDKVNIPIVGLIENMSGFVCSACGAQHSIFGQGAWQAEARTRGLQLLGSIPLALGVRTAADQGCPITHSDPQSNMGQIFAAIAAQVIGH